MPFILHGFTQPPFWLALAGIAAARLLYLVNPALPARIAARGSRASTRCSTTSTTSTASTTGSSPAARGAVGALRVQRRRPDDHRRHLRQRLGDAGRLRSSALFRRIQSGYVYHYAFTMIIGVFGLLYWWGVR